MKAILTKDVYRTKDAAQPDLNMGEAIVGKIQMDRESGKR